MSIIRYGSSQTGKAPETKSIVARIHATGIVFNTTDPKLKREMLAISKKTPASSYLFSAKDHESDRPVLTGRLAFSDVVQTGMAVNSSRSALIGTKGALITDYFAINSIFSTVVINTIHSISAIDGKSDASTTGDATITGDNSTTNTTAISSAGSSLGDGLDTRFSLDNRSRIALEQYVDVIASVDHGLYNAYLVDGKGQIFDLDGHLMKKDDIRFRSQQP
ncbi:hypothetical protein RBB73_01075 [Tunturiibacter empetritectus]|uniref:hypothetical protein n=1 Tax=Tunturiibacter empetritectus TaxID=3069691 RepID=UPI003D9B33EC